MGIILVKIFEKLQIRKNYKIILAGLDNSGKTTLLSRPKTGEILESPETTIGYNLERVELSRKIFEIWELGGHNSIRNLWSFYFTEAKGLIYVVNMNDESRLEESLELLSQIAVHEDLKNVPILLIATKKEINDIDLDSFANHVSNYLRYQKCWKIQISSLDSEKDLFKGLKWLSCAL